MTDKSPIQPTTPAAREMARALILQARFAALGVIDPETGGPYVSRVAMGTDANGAPVSLISDLSHHTVALKGNPECSLLVGEPADKGDLLAHPRLTLLGRAAFIRKGDRAYSDLRNSYLRTHPKAKLYIDFADFSFVRIDASAAHLNGGFGKAFVLEPKDLAPDTET